MLTTLFILLLTLAKPADANPNGTAFDNKARYECIIDNVSDNESASVKYSSMYQENQNSTEKYVKPILIIIAVIVVLIMVRLRTKRDKPLNKEELANKLFLERWHSLQETEIFNSIIERCKYNKHLIGETIMYFQNPLTASEISIFKATIDSLFNDFTHKFSTQHPNLSDVELDYCYISILPLTEIQKAGLLSLSYQGIVSRRKRVTNKLKKSLFSQKLTDFMKKSLKNGLVQ